MKHGNSLPHLAVAALVLTVPAFAQTDLHVSLEASWNGVPSIERVPVGQDVEYLVQFGWTGTVPIADAVVEVELPGPVHTPPPGRGPDYSCTASGNILRCTTNAPFESLSGGFNVYASLTEAGEQVARATISSATVADVNLENNVATRRVEAVPLPLLSITGAIENASRLHPGGKSNVRVNVTNGGSDATNVKVKLSPPEGGAYTDAAFEFANSGTEVAECEVASVVTCAVPSMPSGGYFVIRASFTAPGQLSGGPIETKIDVSADQPDFDPSDDATSFRGNVVRWLLVTSTADAGSGTLRQALLDSSVECADDPCAIVFRIPPPAPAPGWYTIRPATPLPDLRGIVTIDGKSQSDFTGDTNANGPEIEIDGSLLHEWTGFGLGEGCEIRVRNLAINGFPGPGIYMRRGQNENDRCRALSTNFPYTSIEDNYLGTDPTGMLAKPNYRGIIMDGTSFATVERNLISGNRRAGIFAIEGLYAGISRNRIGVARDGSPLGNGASGIYVDLGTREEYSYGADIEGNVIAYNGEWGIARTTSGEIAIRGNSIFGNAYSGIDTNLDFDTPNVPDDRKIPPNRPQLLNAWFDAATGSTVVTGTLDSNPDSFGTFEIELFSTSEATAHPQGEELVAVQPLGSAPHSEFEIRVAADLRGSFLTATSTRRHIIGFLRTPRVVSNGHLYSVPSETSEFSNVITVAP